jgi:hypothetical protein
VRPTTISLFSIVLLCCSTTATGQTLDSTQLRVRAPTPPWRCYAVSPDITPSFFLPDHLILSATAANPTRGAWEPAALRPDSLPLGGRVYRLTASWRLETPESLYVQWSAPRQLLNVLGELYAAARGDSLDGRAIHGHDVPPLPTDWIRVHGHVEPCSGL